MNSFPGFGKGSIEGQTGPVKSLLARVRLMLNPGARAISGRELIVCLFLILAAGAVYAQVAYHDFVSYDDNLYVTENQVVQRGLTAQGVVWAFTTMHADNWHPLTWLSHMIDCELFGMNPAGHHVGSVVFHLMNTVFLFLLLRHMTGALWRSAAVSLLFALHPLHVESVAWISERKDVLSAFFWILTMGAYVRYVASPRLSRYGLVALFFALGLMAKPMVVTLPVVLLLMDYWPLGRFQSKGARSGPDETKEPSAGDPGAGSSFTFLLKEKVPLLVLSLICGAVTLTAQGSGGAVKSMDWLPLQARAANALLSYAEYLGKMVWPRGLAVFYPFPENLQMWKSALALLLLVCMTALVIRLRTKFPYLIVGWLWYLGTLAPVIGIVQVGMQAMADRYTYIPLMGLFIAVSWGIGDVMAGLPHGKIVSALLGSAVVGILMVSSWLQVGHWQDSISLYKHALRVTTGNYLVHNNLGAELLKRGETDEAIAHLREAVTMQPRYTSARINLGAALAEDGKLEDAVSNYKEALAFAPDNPKLHFNLGAALAQQGNLDQAVTHWKKVIQLRPGLVEAHNCLGLALFKQGKTPEAIARYRHSLQIAPDDPWIHVNLGEALMAQGAYGDAARHYARALEINPHLTSARRNRAIALEKLRRAPGRQTKMPAP